VAEEQSGPPNLDRYGANIITQCWHCFWHFRGMYCLAFFPKSIPEMIVNGPIQHLDPFPGDHGKQYLPDDTPPEIAMPDWY
jgi:hypothetical protein